MSDFDFSEGKHFSRFTLGRAEVVNARFQEVAEAIATKLDKAGGTITGNVTINGSITLTQQLLLGVAPTLDMHAATKKYVDDANAQRLALSGGTMTGDIAMGGHKVTGLPTPTDAGDGTPKGYVDAILGSAQSAQTSANQAQAALNSILSKITVSTAAPSGGNDGDLWFRIA